MRLSHGFVRGEMLACLYHGWHFASGGRCARIPAHPDLEPPGTIHAEVHGAAERGGVIWAAPGSDPAPPAMPEGLTPVRSLAVDAPEGAVRRALDAGEGAVLDLSAPLPDGAMRLVVVLGSEPGGATMVHALTDAGAPPDRLDALSDWLETARRAAEDAP
jgi:hypothetical protein